MINTSLNYIGEQKYEYKTYDNLSGMGSIKYYFGDKTRFFISLGGGINILMPYKNKEVKGSIGRTILIEEPEQKSNPWLPLAVV